MVGILSGVGVGSAGGCLRAGAGAAHALGVAAVVAAIAAAVVLVELVAAAAVSAADAVVEEVVLADADEDASVAQVAACAEVSAEVSQYVTRYQCTILHLLTRMALKSSSNPDPSTPEMFGAAGKPTYFATPLSTLTS